MTMVVAWTGLATAEPQVNNLVPNNSVEEAGTSGLPESWLTNQWGTNDASFQYLSTGYTGTRSVRVEITDYTSGDAKWVYPSQPVTAGSYYRFSDYYLSDVTTHVVVALKDGTGATEYVPLKDAFANNTWTKYEAGLMIPAGAVSASVYHVLAKTGSLTTDEFSFREAPAPAPFARGIVSITFDDGYATDYDTALPILQKHGLSATHYVFVDAVGDTANGYMTADQIIALAAAGEEIGSHTVTHARLTQLEPSQVASELANSKNILESILATEVASFALPYGDFDAQVIAQVRNHYRSSRTTISGYNTPYNIDPYRIVVMPLDYATSLSEVQTWVDTAKQENYWLVLMYHKIDDSGGSSVRAEDLDAALAYIKGSGVEVKTVGEALDEVEPQSEPVSVPNVAGSTRVTAAATITSAGLVLGTVTEAYHATVPSGDVISQTPAAGTLVAPASEVDLVVSKGPEPVSVPNVAGSTRVTAAATITSAGLVLGTVTEAYHATVPSGDVISQTPAAGTLVAPASEVDLVVSKGPEPVSVPGEVSLARTSPSRTLSKYGQTYYFTGKLTSAGASLAGKRVYLEQSSSYGGSYSYSGRYATTRSDGTFTIAIVARNRTFYRAYFGGAEGKYTAAYSSIASVMPRTHVSEPRAPRYMRSTKRYTVYGYLKPRHTASTSPVRIYKWKKTASGKWKRDGYVKAKAHNYGSYTKYKVKMRLSKAGTWRLRAYAPADSKHAAAWSSGYDYVKVK